MFPQLKVTVTGVEHPGGNVGWKLMVALVELVATLLEKLTGPATHSETDPEYRSPFGSDVLSVVELQVEQVTEASPEVSQEPKAYLLSILATILAEQDGEPHSSRSLKPLLQT